MGLFEDEKKKHPNKRVIQSFIPDEQFEELNIAGPEEPRRIRPIADFGSALSPFKLGFPNSAYRRKKKLLAGKRGEYEMISMPFSDYDITKSKFYIDSDIVHLHWVADFLDYKSFFRKCKKPIVVTLRDLFPIQGIFHYEKDISDNLDDFGSIEQMMAEIKFKSIRKFKHGFN